MSPRQQKRSVIEERWRRTFATSRRCGAAVSPKSRPQPSPFWHQTTRASSPGRSSTAAAASPDMTDAKKTGRSKSYYAREAILRQIEDIEDYHLARRRLARDGSRVTLETL